MPKVYLPYTYVAAATMSPDDHNKNNYDVDLTGGHEHGIMSCPNGGLEYDPTGTTKNLPSTFVLYPEHVQIQEGIWGSEFGNTKPVDIVDEVFADGSKAEFIRLPGPCLRFNVNRDADTVLYWCEFFLHASKPIYDLGGVKTEPTVIVRPVIDGAAVTALGRRINATIAYNDNGSTGTSSTSDREMRNARWYSLCWAVEDVAEGPSEIGLQIYVEKASISTSIARVFGLGADAITSTVSHKIKTRITMGVRNAGFLIL